MKHTPPPLELLKGQAKPVRFVKFAHREKATVERLAIWITDHVGTMGFFLIILVWTILWLGWNIIAPKPLQFDPYPGFVFWLFISNMIQILLMPLIMVGQNLQERHSDQRAEADYEVNTKAEREIEAILMHLENQNDMMLEILKRLEKAKD
jgi:uncharacterized membrane protein